MGRVAAPHIITDDSALGGSVIEKSLRFDRNDNAYLSRTPSSAGNRKTFTFSAWVKLGQTGINVSNDPGNGPFFSCGAAGTGSNMTLRITNNGYIGIDYYGIGGFYSTGRLRDPNAWYHCVWVMDTTESTAANRMKVYVNGDLFYNSGMNLSQNADTPLNNNNVTTIGAYSYNTSYAYKLDVYLTEVNFIDGQALTPSSFGYTDSQTGLWRPKKYEGVYGTNGFHLEFKDNSSTSALGKDTSGNGNNFSVSNISAGEELVTNGEFNSDSDWSKDSSWTISGGKASNGGGGQIYQTISVVSGKIYKMKAIMDFTSVSSIANTSIGFRDTGDSSFYAYQATFSNGSKTDFTPNAINEMSVTWISTVTGSVRARCYSSDDVSIDNWSVKEVTDCMLDTPSDRYATLNSVNGYSYNTTFANGNLFANIPASNTYGRAFGNIPIKSGKWYWEVYYNQAGGNGNYLYVGLQDPESGFYRAVRGSDGEQYPNTGGTAVRFATGDIINVAVDLDNGKWYIGRNGTYWYSGNPVAGTGFVHSDLISANPRTPIDGLVPLFYNATGGATQQFSVNFGQQPLSYTPPTGYKIINSKNLPVQNDPIIRPQKHFDTITYTGSDTSSARTVTGLEFSPDLVWQKRRNGTNWHSWFDTVRGVGKELFSNSNTTETTNNQYGYISSFNNDGFTWSPGSTNNSDGNESSGTFVSWCWKAGGAAVTNTDGSITSQVSVNEEAGFSIISYSGNNTDNATVGHGLGKTPALLITKNRDNTISPAWHISHVSLQTNYDVALDSTDAAWNPSTNGWHELTNSSVFTLKKGSTNGYNTNRNGDNYIAYCWAEIPGYSKFGKYTGNGNTNGAFINLGFKPAWILVKRSSASENWALWDNKRDGGFNPNGYLLRPDSTNDEGGNVTGHQIDLLSNGFKLRFTDTKGNGNGSTYIYMAFAEQPGLTPYDTQTNAR